MNMSFMIKREHFFKKRKEKSFPPVLASRSSTEVTHEQASKELEEGRWTHYSIDMCGTKDTAFPLCPGQMQG